jgi:ribosomal protein L11 methyltransferase
LKWVELSLRVDGELAEAVSEVLSRYAPVGVASEIAIGPEHSDLLTGLVTLRTYLPVDENLADLRETIERGLWHLSQIKPLPEPSYRELEEADWENAWRERYHPIPIGDKLLIVPPWYEIDSGDRKPLLIEPGMAFGTGTHPTTQLCLRLIESRLKSRASMIDLGCGSGILSIAAALLGAARVLALDIDPAAVEITRLNAEQNGVADKIIARQGSFEKMADLMDEFNITSTELLVANILANVLSTMIDDGLGDFVTADGSLILSGILDEQLPDLLAKARKQGLTPRQVRGDGDWRAVEFSRTSG